MKLNILLLSLISAVSFTGVNKPSSVNQTQNRIQNKPLLRWITHGPLLINASETYYFDVDNPNHDKTYPDYTYYGTFNPNVGVNEADYSAFAYDSTDTSVRLIPQYSLSEISDVRSEGLAFFGLSYLNLLPDHCAIADDTRHLNDCFSVFRLSNGANPRIGRGIVLFRSSANGTFYGWDNYQSLEDFQRNPALRVAFEVNRYVQIAMLYEVDNFDNRWLFKNHEYYHNVGIYSFYTTPQN